MVENILISLDNMIGRVSWNLVDDEFYALLPFIEVHKVFKKKLIRAIIFRKHT